MATARGTEVPALTRSVIYGARSRDRTRRARRSAIGPGPARASGSGDPEEPVAVVRAFLQEIRIEKTTRQAVCRWHRLPRVGECGIFGGAEGARTPDPKTASLVLSHRSYSPTAPLSLTWMAFFCQGWPIPATTPADLSGGRLLGRGERRLVVGLVGDLLDVFPCLTLPSFPTTKTARAGSPASGPSFTNNPEVLAKE